MDVLNVKIQGLKQILNIDFKYLLKLFKTEIENCKQIRKKSMLVIKTKIEMGIIFSVSSPENMSVKFRYNGIKKILKKCQGKILESCQTFRGTHYYLLMYINLSTLSCVISYDISDITQYTLLVLLPPKVS